VGGGRGAYEEDVVSQANVVHGLGGDLAGHGVHSDRGHGSKKYTAGSSSGAEHFGGNNPG